MVQLVTAIVKPQRVAAVRDALHRAGVPGITITEVRGFGRQGGHTETYRDAEYHIEFVPKVKVEVLCETGDAEAVAATIAEAARSERIGDGKIWSTSADSAVRVRTGERDGDAL